MKEVTMKNLNAKKIESLKLRQSSPLATPTDLKAGATKDIAGSHERHSGGCVRALHQDQELPLAYERSALP